MTPLPRLGTILLSAAVFIAGCNKDETAIRTYVAPKDIPAPQVASADQPQADAASADSPAPSDAPPIAWTVPDGWKQIQGGDSMRFATFNVSLGDPKALLTVVQLGAEAADLLPNVKRWAGQLKLPEPKETDLSKYVHQTQVSGEQGQIVEMTGAPDSGEPPTSLLAAIVPHDGATWFFTLKASQPVAESQKANFEKFVHSVQFPSGAAGPTAATPPSNAPPGEDSASSTASYKLVKWQAPAGWQEQPGSNSMRVTSFRAGEGDAQAEVIVSRIGRAQMGSFVDNINRWRGQVGLEPVTSLSPGLLQPTEVAGHPALILSFTGPPDGGSAKKVTVVLDIEGQDFWFVKLLGPESVVAGQQNSLKQFLNSMRFEPEAH